MAEMTLLPCAKDVCQECAVDHAPEEPHNAQSLYYQYKFYGEHGRWPTWKDAIEHCDDKTKETWKQVLTQKGHWTEQEQQTTQLTAKDQTNGDATRNENGN